MNTCLFPLVCCLFCLVESFLWKGFFPLFVLWLFCSGDFISLGMGRFCFCSISIRGFLKCATLITWASWVKTLAMFGVSDLLMGGGLW